MADNYPDLNLLFDQLGPMGGAYATGQRQQMGLQSQGLEQANQASMIRARELENLYNDQAMGTRLDQGRANLGQTLAGTQGQMLKNQLGAGTMDSTIAATNAGNKAQMSNEQIKSLQIAGQYLGQFGTELEQVPPLKRTETMAGMLKANPSLQESPGFMSIMDMPPEQQPAALQKLSQKLVATSPGMQQDMAKINAQGQKQLQAIGAQGANAMALQNAAIEAGKYNRSAGKSRDAVIENIKNPAERQGALIDAATEAMQNGDQQAAMNYMQRAQAIDQAARNRNASAGAQNTTIGPAGIENRSRASDVPSAIPQLGPNGPMKPQAPTLSSVQSQYPGVPADKLREAYKKKFGVDLR